MAAFAKKDIVLFPFPFTDLSKTKLRPCLVISDEMNDDIILCQITSKKIKSDKFTIEVKKSETINGSLQIDSYIRCNMIFTALKYQIIKKICSISDSKYNEVVRMITSII